MQADSRVKYKDLTPFSPSLLCAFRNEWDPKGSLEQAVDKLVAKDKEKIRTKEYYEALSKGLLSLKSWC